MPGAGKTSLANALAHRLRSTGVLVHTPHVESRYDVADPVRLLRQRAWFLAGRAVRHPADTWRATRCIGSSRQASGAAFRTAWENWLTVADMIERSRRTPGVHLVDQGVLQALFSVGLEAAHPNMVNLIGDLRARRHLADICVFVRTERDVVARRVSRRERTTRGRQRVLADGEHAWAHGEAIFDELRDWIRSFARASDPRLVEVTGDTVVERVLDDIEREILEVSERTRT